MPASFTSEKPPAHARVEFRRLALLFLAASCLDSGCNRPSGLSQNAASVKAALQQIYSAQDAAIARKDANAFYGVCAPSFVETDMQGNTSTLAQDKQVFANICAHSRSIATQGIVQSVSLLPHGGVDAVVDVHVTTLLINPQGILDTHETVRDMWTSTPAGWRLASSRVLATRSTSTGLLLSPTSPKKS